MKMNARSFLAAATLGAAMTLPLAANAESGFFLGGSVGSAQVEVDLNDAQLPDLPDLPDKFDEDDTAWKVFGGYTWDLSAGSLGIEAAYINFGKPSLTVNDENLVVKPKGFSVWGVGSFALGPVDLFGKVGALSWDADAEFAGSPSTDDGTDAGYGVGLRFNAGRFQIRGEYEIFNVDEADLSMLSVGVGYTF